MAGPIVELKDTRRMVEEEESLATLTRTMSSKFQPLGPTSKGKLPKARYIFYRFAKIKFPINGTV